MGKYYISIEEAEKPELLEQNYKDLMISIIAACLREVEENEKSSNLSESINGGAS